MIRPYNARQDLSKLSGDRLRGRLDHRSDWTEDGRNSMLAAIIGPLPGCGTNMSRFDKIPNCKNQLGRCFRTEAFALSANVQ